MKSLERSCLWMRQTCVLPGLNVDGERMEGFVDSARERGLKKLALLRLKAPNELFQGSAPSFLSGGNRMSAVPPVCELHSNGLAW
jgi:hypothetical protein